MPTLEKRTLWFHPDKPAMFYNYKKCVKSGIFGCRKEEIITEYYDLTDPVVRKQLIDVGFVAKVREVVQPK